MFNKKDGTFMGKMEKAVIYPVGLNLEILKHKLLLKQKHLSPACKLKAMR